MTVATFFLPGWSRLTDDAGQPLWRAQTTLGRLLSYAQPHPVEPLSSLQRMAWWLHQPVPLPVAPVTAALDLPDFDRQAFWVRLDPVHLVPDRDTLVLFPASDVGITEVEARSLVDAFNQHFQPEGIRLEYGAPDRWYVRVPQPVDIQTTPLTEAVGTNLHHVQPQGSAARYWNRLINEAQMLFFQHPVNETRRERGMPEVNGLWLWGEGGWPDGIRPRPGLSIVNKGHEPWLEALAHAVGATCDDQAWRGADAVFYYQPAGSYPDVDSARVELARLSEQVFEPLWQGLKTGRIREAALDFGGDVAWYLKPGYLRRFWRRWRRPQM